MRKSLVFLSATLAASFWIACQGTGGSGGTGGACGTATDACTTSLQCCSGFECNVGHCAFLGGNGNGNGNGNGGNGGSTTGSNNGGGSTGHGSSSGGLIGGTNGFGGTSGSTGAASTGGGSSTGAVTTTYCDGLELDSNSDNTVLLETYIFEGQLTTDGCDATLSADLDGAQVTSVGGIYDVDANDNGVTPAAEAIFPAGCDDLGLSTFVAPSGTPFTAPPAGASTVAAAVAAQTTVPAMYGVVTAIKPWVVTPTAKSGQLYLQDIPDGTPAPKSGILVYMSSKEVATFGAIPARGDVVEITNLNWSPYLGQNQFASTATSVVTILGTSPLPEPVVLGASDVGPTATTNGQQYYGMRVSVSDSPFTVTGSGASATCPPSLEATVTGL